MASGIQIQTGQVRSMAIEVKNLNFSYPGRPVLRSINLEIHKQDFVGITGSTGSGKTTLACCFNGLIPHAVRGDFSGTVKVCGLDTRQHRIAELAKTVGMVFQDPDWQLFTLSVREEIAFGLKNLKMGDVEKRTRGAIRMVGLEGYDETEPFKLSQGQKQKLCIASVLAMEPEIIVLDEPVSQLDYRSMMNVYHILRRLNREGKTIIVIEHNTDLLAQFSSKTMLMDKGQVVRYDETKKVLSEKRMLERLGVKVPGCFRK